MDRATDAIIEFMEEVYDGPNHSYTWFIGNAPGSGILGTVRKIEAKEVSTPLIEGGTTIASHIGHLRWTLQKVNSYLRGENPSWDWSESWPVRCVDESEWGELIESLKSEFREVVQSLRSGIEWQSDNQYKEILALIPHAAYHLGAIRQMALIIKNKSV